MQREKCCTVRTSKFWAKPIGMCTQNGIVCIKLHAIFSLSAFCSLPDKALGFGLVAYFTPAGCEVSPAQLGWKGPYPLRAGYSHPPPALAAQGPATASGTSRDGRIPVPKPQGVLGGAWCLALPP